MAAAAAAAGTDARAQQQSTATVTDSFSRWVPSISLPTMNFNQLNPFANTSEDAKTNDPPKPQSKYTSKTASANKRSFLSTASLFSTSTPSKGDSENLGVSREASPARSNTMFAEPDTRSTTSSDAQSEDQSLKVRKSQKPKTRFSVCHPPPAGQVKQRLHRRPRSLLQLHKLTPGARPVPAIEVVPSANFSVRLTRAITKVFKGKHGLCANDLVVLRAEKYVSVDDERESELQDATDIVGLICKGKKQDTKEDPTAGREGKAKICMASGAEWEAYPLMNGGYEFFSTDEHGLGLTVRWVPKKNKDGTKTTQKDGSKKFNFSTISPNSRRHPVIGTLSKTALEINDAYKMPEASPATPLSTPKQGGGSVLETAMDEEGEGKEQCETDDALREIITMTGIWVTFKEGWSPSFKYDDAKEVQQRAASAMSTNASPSKSFTAGSPRNTPPGSPGRGMMLEKRSSIKSVGSSILRRSSMLTKGNRASQSSVPEETIFARGSLGRSSSAKQTGRARADSSSTVLVHRAASNRRKNNAATWRPDLLNAQHQLQERSNEDLGGTPPQRADTMPADIWDSPASTATPNRRMSVFAEPLIPDFGSGSEGSPTSATKQRAEGAVAAPTSVPAEPEERISDATTVTAASGASEAGAAPQAEPRNTGNSSVKANGGKVKDKERRRSGWRRLLCISE